MGQDVKSGEVHMHAGRTVDIDIMLFHGLAKIRQPSGCIDGSSHG